MAKKENVRDLSAWAGMFKDFFRQIQDESITWEQLDAFLGHRNPFDPEEEQYFTIVDDGKKKTSELIAELRKSMPVRLYREEKIDEEFLAPKKPTSRKFLLTQEADEDLKNKSANDLEKEGVEGITLRERLLYERRYFEKTGQHLDIKSITLCSGSRYAVGHVPCVYWDSDELSVHRYSPGDRYDFLRSRRAV